MAHRNKGFVAIPFEGSFNLGALASDAVVSTDMLGGDLTEDFFAISCDIEAELIALTAGEGNPSMLGIAHGDYANTEIAEALLVKLLGPGNKIEQERARRLVRKSGTFHGDGLNTATEMAMQGRKGPGIDRVKLKFMLQSGVSKGLSVFVFNKSGAVYTTGGVCKFWGTLYGRWVL